MKKLIALIFCCFCVKNTPYAQSSFFGSWNVVNAQYSFTEKTSIWIEGQLRSQKFINDFFYHEMKTGINIKPNKNFNILLGMGQYATYSNGGNFKSPTLSHEFRLWEQFTLVNNIGRVKLEHRYRIEQRWRNDNYLNRFRYRINPIIPVNKPKMTNHTIFATLYNEVFFTDKPSYFERNRFFAGLGYQFSKTISVQTGWIRQFDYTPSTSTSKDFMLTTLFIRMHQKNPTTENHPSSLD